MIDFKELARIRDCRLWSGIATPLSAVRFEGAKYITPEMERHIEFLKDYVSKDWEKVSSELASTGLLEEKVIELKEKIEGASKEGIFEVHGRTVAVMKNSTSFSLYRSGETFGYLSPEAVNDAHKYVSSLTPVAQLREDREFIEGFERLAKEYKPELTRGRGVEPAIHFGEQGIREMLAGNGLVQAATLKHNIAGMLEELPYYKAAYERRQAFDAELKRRCGAKNPAYCTAQQGDIMREWRNAHLAGVYSRIKGDEGICRLVNGQAEGYSATAGTRHPAIRATGAYSTTTLSMETFKKWVDTSYEAKFNTDYVITGQGYRFVFWNDISRRIGSQYSHPDNAGGKFITESDRDTLYPAAVSRLKTAFDNALLEFLPKTLP